MEQGLLHIYCGDGKGKTTAAVGLAVRAAGCGLRVLVTQFLKNGESGELHILAQLKPQVTLLSGAPVEKFLWTMTEQEQQAVALEHTRRLAEAFSMAREGAFDLLLLDEVIPAVTTGLIEEKQLVQSLLERPQGLEVAMTGRDPSAALCEMADYISEIKAVKHPYEIGQEARVGIEF